MIWKDIQTKLHVCDSTKSRFYEQLVRLEASSVKLV